MTILDVTDHRERALRERPWLGQLGHRGGCDGHRGGTISAPPFSGQLWFRIWTPTHRKCGADGTIMQEFSIEIPDKDADTIHSGMLAPLPDQ